MRWFFSGPIAKDTCWVRERYFFRKRFHESYSHVVVVDVGMASVHAKHHESVCFLFAGLRKRNSFVKNGCFGMKDHSTTLKCYVHDIMLYVKDEDVQQYFDLLAAGLDDFSSLVVLHRTSEEPGFSGPQVVMISKRPV